VAGVLIASSPILVAHTVEPTGTTAGAGALADGLLVHTTVHTVAAA
jgi:hypothetical protein